MSDNDEKTWGTCPDNNSCTGTSATDYDGDGLTDGAEVNQLGTSPKHADSDGDTITDTLEIEGFTYNDQTWYLDPMEADTNKDGIADMTECRPLSLFADAPGDTCPDTDGDGAPDVWDDDNDGDGVHDSVDLSPFKVLGLGSAFKNNNPFLFQTNQAETGWPLFVDLQFRPTNPDHLTHQYHVLDWPAGDTDGHIRRKLNTTFATTSSAAQNTASNAGFGDMRLVPMLKIDIPYQNGHYGNLPTIDNAPTITASTPLTAWLDTSVLDPYGISVSKKDENSGDLILYAPVNLVKDRDGGSNVAFTTRIPYQPSQNTWGNSHEYRLVWLVQLLTDQCVDADNDGSIADEDVETCGRVEDVQVIHVYNDAFFVTGLEVTEDRGYDVALIAQSPASDLVYEDALWEVVNNLSLTFVEGTDCAAQTYEVTCSQAEQDGQRDVTVATLDSYVSQWITETTMIVEQKSYPHQGYAAHVMMTDTVSLLDDNFEDYQDQNPTIAFAQEKSARSLNLDQISTVTATLIMDLDPDKVPVEVLGSLNWAPYEYDAAVGAWQNQPLVDYWGYLQTILAQHPDFQLETEDLSNGLIRYAQLYQELRGQALEGPKHRVFRCNRLHMGSF